MTNIQVTHSLWYNARSESYVTINPNNPQQMVAGSKKFKDIYNYDFTIATAYSSDGGHNWYPSQDLKITGWAGITDPALTWDDIGHVYLVGLAFTNPPKIDGVGIAVYKSIDGGATWSDPKLIHASASDDKQWAAADSSSLDYRGRVYAAWSGDGGIRFARTLDHGKTWIGIGTDPAGSLVVKSVFFLMSEISVAANGYIYIVWSGAQGIGMTVSKDGGDSFHPSKEHPAIDITPLSSCLESIHGYSVFPNGTFRVYTLATACTGPLPGQVMVAWADCRESGVSRIYYARSEDAGDSWITGEKGQPLLTSVLPANQQHFHPQIVMKPNGVVGCAFYEFGPKPTDYLIDVIMAQSIDGKTFSHHTVTDQPWDPTLDAPFVHIKDPPYITSEVTFIGEYFGLDASNQGFYPLWTDTRTGIQELWVDVPKIAVAFPSEPETVAKPPGLLSKPPSFEEWIIGLINDSGGWIIPGGIKPGPPRPGPPPPLDLTQDILLGLANYRIATLVTSKEGRALQKAALIMLANVVRQQLQQLRDKE
jgi:hypothetical protein